MAFKRVNKVFISNVAADTANVALFSATGGGLADLIAEGEAVVMDENRQLLAADATIEDSGTIYIAVGTDVTFAEGVNTYRELEYSDPIEAKNVLRYFGTNYAAATQKVATFDPGTFVPVVGTEYIVKVVYKDLHEHPANFSYSYRIVSTTAVANDLIDLFVTRINADDRRRVNAVRAGTDLVLTARNIPSNLQLNAIDEYRQVEFEVAPYRVIVGNALAGTFDQHLPWAADSDVAYTAGSPGYGTPALVRDAEKHALSHKGITNRTCFPVIKPELRTVMANTYDIITIVSNKSYVSANNQYVETAPLLTQIYKRNDHAYPAFIAVLDSWMESAGFEPVAEDVS